MTSDTGTNNNKLQVEIIQHSGKKDEYKCHPCIPWDAAFKIKIVLIILNLSYHDTTCKCMWQFDFHTSLWSLLCFQKLHNFALDFKMQST